MPQFGLKIIGVGEGQKVQKGSVVSGLIMKEKNITVQTSTNNILSCGLNIKPCFSNLLPFLKTSTIFE